MNKYQVRFDQLKTGVEFTRNGNRWIKQSTRTARIIKPAEYSKQWFYFGMADKCIVTDINKGVNQ